jgi:hypothetical protein
VKIYVAAVEALRKKERGGQNTMKLSLTQKKMGGIPRFTLASPPPPTLNANVLFDRFVFNLTRFWTKLKVLVLCFPDFTMENSFV